MNNKQTFEIRIYFPKTVVKERLQAYVGKPVRVTGWYPYEEYVGQTPGKTGVYEMRWYGKVHELDMKIPEDELLKPQG